MSATPAKLKLLPLFVRHIFSSVMATPGCANIIAIEKDNPDNIDLIAIEILFSRALEIK